MARVLDRQAVEVLRAASATGDRTVDVYLDRERLVVVKVRNGVCTPGDLDPQDVERGEQRFAEVPVVTTITEYLWMQAFVEDRGEDRGEDRVEDRGEDRVEDRVEDRGERAGEGDHAPRIASWLDGRAGANARFLKRLAAQAPDVLADWQAFRSARIDEMVADWLRDLGVTVAA